MTPSWDLFLTVFFIVGTAYGMMMQRERTVATLLSIYVGIVMTQLLTEPIGQFFQGERTISSFFVNSSVSPFTIQSILFLATIVLVTTKSGISGGRDSVSSLLSPFEMLSYSFLNTALIVTTVISFLPEESRASIIAQSNMAGFLASHHTWWLVLPVITLIAFGWNRRPLWRI
ncbi:hypothetical protein HY375_03435 [Candidatus Berkelbacteria bacterium]|nr:hypothetical protein [Candidatus Berkelbacteria bacterium]